MITYLKYENRQSKTKTKIRKHSSKIFKTVDIFIVIATTSTSVTLSHTGVGSIVIPISTGKACVLHLN